MERKQSIMKNVALTIINASETGVTIKEVKIGENEYSITIPQGEQSAIEIDAIGQDVTVTYDENGLSGEKTLRNNVSDTLTLSRMGGKDGELALNAGCIG